MDVYNMNTPKVFFLFCIWGFLPFSLIVWIVEWVIEYGNVRYLRYRCRYQCDKKQIKLLQSIVAYLNALKKKQEFDFFINDTIWGRYSVPGTFTLPMRGWRVDSKLIELLDCKLKTNPNQKKKNWSIQSAGNLILGLKQ